MSDEKTDLLSHGNIAKELGVSDGNVKAQIEELIGEEVVSLTEKAVALTRKAMELALAGDTTALRLALEPKDKAVSVPCQRSSVPRMHPKSWRQ